MALDWLGLVGEIMDYRKRDSRPWGGGGGEGLFVDLRTFLKKLTVLN
jgi:hypothetical protein